ncbi:hypothetical protein CLOSTHATH_07423, partial [Hungatella hathewayi DSM 13479]
FLVIAPVSVWVTVLITRRMVRPLKELNEAAKQIDQRGLKHFPDAADKG